MEEIQCYGMPHMQKVSSNSTVGDSEHGSVPPAFVMLMHAGVQRYNYTCVPSTHHSLFSSFKLGKCLVEYSSKFEIANYNQTQNVLKKFKKNCIP